MLDAASGQRKIHTGHKVDNKNALPRKGKRTSSEEKRERARKMKAAGHSYGEIGKALGVSRSYAYKLVNEPVPSTKTSSIMDQDMSLETLLASFKNGRNSGQS